MATRGRPVTVGESSSIRVPRDLYVMVNLIADAMKVSTTQVADKFIRPSLGEVYLQVLPEIRRRYQAEVTSAEWVGRAPLPLADFRVFLLPNATDANGNKVPVDPKTIHPKGQRHFYVSELSDEALAKAIKLEILIPETLRIHPTRPGDLLKDDEDEYEVVFEHPGRPTEVAESKPVDSGPEPKGTPEAKPKKTTRKKKPKK